MINGVSGWAGAYDEMFGQGRPVHYGQVYSTLARLLLGMVSEQVRFNWAGMAAITGAGVGVVLLVTALSLPALRRLMRPDGLRTE